MMADEDMGRFLDAYRPRVAKEGPSALAAEAKAFVLAVRDGRLLDERETELPSAAAVLALAEAHPDGAAWREEEPALFKRASWVLRRADDARAGLNDALYARWRVLGRREDAEALARAAGRRDIRGTTCRWMLGQVLGRDPELAEIVRPMLRALPPDLRAEIQAGGH